MKKVTVTLLAFLMPCVTLAATIEDILSTTQSLLEQIIGLLIVIATIVFMWGIIRYLSAAGNEEKIREGRNLMIFGIIGLAVMISVWGIVKIITATFDIGGEAIPTIP